MDRAQYIAITSHYSSCWRIAEIWKILEIPEDTVLRYFIKELFWKISQISQKLSQLESYYTFAYMPETCDFRTPVQVFAPEVSLQSVGYSLWLSSCFILFNNISTIFQLVSASSREFPLLWNLSAYSNFD